MVADITLGDLNDALNNTLIAAAITNNIAWPNVSYTPAKGIPYLKVENAGRSRMPLGIGADTVEQWNGFYQVSVFTPRDSGEREQARLASLVLAAFPRGLTLVTPQDIRLIVTASTAAIPVPFGDWVNLPVTVSWFATEPP